MKRIVVIVILLAAALSAAYGALIYYDNNFKYGRMRETPAVKPHEDPIPNMDEGVVPVHGGEALFRHGKGEALSSPLKCDAPKTLAAGKRAYFTYCVPCHGRYLDGLGTVGQSFYPLPTNLKSPEVLNQDDASLFYTIGFGQKRMPALATTIAVNDRWAVIHYVRAFTVGSVESK